MPSRGVHMKPSLFERIILLKSLSLACAHCLHDEWRNLFSSFIFMIFARINCDGIIDGGEAADESHFFFLAKSRT